MEKILAASELTKNDLVIEVGPGPGYLTQYLVQKAGRVICWELDQTLANYLKEHFSSQENCQIINQDALKATPPSEKYKLVANIPYYITSPLINHFLQTTAPAQSPELLVLLVQLEVAQKICAKTGDHSILSLQTQIFGTPKMISRVAPGNFYPAPQVDSAILQITPYQRPLINNLPLFHKIISGAFAQKRKTLENTLSQTLQISKSESADLLANAQLSPLIRPQALSISDWQNLIQVLEAHHFSALPKNQ